MQKKTGKLKNHKSFTIVELTVSMGILALIVGLTAGILISVVRSYQRQRIVSEIERNGDFVLRSIEETLRGAYSISCVDYDGDPVNPGGGPTNCDLMSDQLINLAGVNNTFFGVGSDQTPTASCTTPGSLDSGDPELCYIFSMNSINDIEDSGNLSSEDLIMTNNAANGANITDFTASISGGGSSGKPYNITVTIVIEDTGSLAWIDESRTFQSFLTLRGSYQ